MTAEKHDPWTLLREARKLVGFCPITQDGMDVVKDVRERIDAALAERADSAKDVVEWQMTNSPIGTTHAYLDGVDLRVRWDGQDAAWDATRYGRCATEAEAKQAAIAAAKGMK
jgi:hypothetical protein